MRRVYRLALTLAVIAPLHAPAFAAEPERWRWLPHDLGPYYVTVNIPEFTLRIVALQDRAHNARRGRQA
jgi:murein L,D-transpeptidase YcbB/YkuD